MRTKYDWSNVPKNVKRIATDLDGSLCGYSAKPQRFSHGWNTHYNRDFVAHSFLSPYQANWQDSLEERPSEDNKI